MEITNSTQSATTYTTTNQKDSSSSDKSFDELLDTPNQKDSKANTTSKADYIEASDATTQIVTYTQDVAKVQDEAYDPDKKFLNFLDENYPEYFEKNGISKEDEKAIRTVLADNEVSDYESRQLSFEQAQTLHKISLNRLEYGPEDTENMMILPVENNKVRFIFQSTELTKNDTFNESIFQAFVENLTLDEDEMFNIINELSYTLSQAYHGMDFGLNMNQGALPSKDSPKIDTSNFDYENYLVNLLSHIQVFSDKQNDPKTQKQYDLLMTNFGQILNNYNKLQDEEKHQEQ